MREQAEALRERTKAFAIRVVRFAKQQAGSDAGQVMGRQLIRSATAIAANYRATCLARSRAEFIARMGLVAEESDETVYWLEIMLATGTGKRDELEAMLAEARELAAIFLASNKTLRSARATATPKS
jgi:four helix bundle protein